MNKLYTLLLLITVPFILSTVPELKETSKKVIEQRIRTWYEAHPDSYTLELKKEDSTALITRYHTERPDEKDDLIEVHMNDMRITFAFKKPFEEFEWSVDNLNAEFSYVSISKMYNDINAPGWDIYPLTPQSSKRGGVTFDGSTDKEIAFSINWEIFTVSGYANSKKCNDQMMIADGPLTKDCYVGVNKRIPLFISGTLPIQKNK